MSWATPQYSKSQVNRAGDILVADLRSHSDVQWALGVVNNWRASHSFPLNTMQMYLRGKANQVDDGPLIAQRIKRLSSIELKLVNQPGMRLSRMQDIGGCRAVVSNVAAVRNVRDQYKGSRIKHQLVKEDDYIAHPKTSGYRGIHRVYKYYSDRTSTYNGLQIEIQIRSQLQHAWATAVETVGTFLQQSLKASQGSDDWLRFFALMGSAIASIEHEPIVPGTPDNARELVREVRACSKSLDVARKLRAYSSTIRTLDESDLRNAHYFLLELRPSEGRVTVTAYTKAQLPEATEDYMQVERALSGPGDEAVLVSVESLSILRRAYPNYFLDTGVFLETLEQVLQ